MNGGMAAAIKRQHHQGKSGVGSSQNGGYQPGDVYGGSSSRSKAGFTILCTFSFCAALRFFSLKLVIRAHIAAARDIHWRLLGDRHKLMVAWGRPHALPETHGACIGSPLIRPRTGTWYDITALENRFSDDRNATWTVYSFLPDLDILWAANGVWR